MLRWFFILFVALMAIGLALLFSVASPGFVETGDFSTYRDAGKAYEVRIFRDTWGVPHIYGTKDRDVAFGVAFAHAEDDFRTIQESIMTVRGQFSSVDGQLPRLINAATSRAGLGKWFTAKGFDPMVVDYLAQLLRVREKLDARYETDLAPDVRAAIEAYAMGLNAYAARHPDAIVPGFQPVTGREIAAGFHFFTPFFYGLPRAIAELYEPERRHEISGPEQGGSNAAAVAPARSADKRTRLLINSHQPYTGPLAWWEVRVHSEEGWNMHGGLFPLSPFILHGFGEKLGWANTTNHPDLADFYVLTINPANPNQYKFDGVWRDLERGTARIKLRVLGSFALTVEQETLHSVYGPVIRRPHGVYAFRHAGHDRINQVEQYFRLNKAQTFEAFEAALKVQAIPNQNYVYADAKGRIAYYYNATFPKRDPAYDWSQYLPGDTSRTLWTEYLPFEAMPRVVDPGSGLVFNANNTPFNATADPDNPRPEDFPAFMGVEKRNTNRGLRLRELLEADTSITADEFQAIKFDKTYAQTSQMAEVVTALLAHDFGEDAMMKQAQDVMRRYRTQLNAHGDNRGTALAIMTGLPAVAATFFGGEARDPIPLFRKAAETLMRHFGRLDPEWREVNRFRRGAIDEGTGGAPDVLRAVESTMEVSADGRFEANKGDTLLFFVDWDEAGQVNATGIHQFGSATLNAKSPHYADQVVPFLNEKVRPIWFTREALAGHIAREYRPGVE